MRRSLIRGAAVFALATVAVLGLAGPAAAHVTVNPNSATQGGYTKVAFRVPNEKDTASTVKLEVNLPPDAPIASVSVKPVNGWNVVAQKGKLATPITTDDGQITEGVTKITWTAASAATAIKPGQFQEFEVSLGPLPKVDKVVFKALQTYSDGDIVRWIDLPNADGSQPDHPAPVLRLTAATASGAAPAAVTVAANNDPPANSNGSAGVVLGIIGIIVGAVGLVFGFLGFRTARATATRA